MEQDGPMAADDPKSIGGSRHHTIN